MIIRENGNAIPGLQPVRRQPVANRLRAALHLRVGVTLDSFVPLNLQRDIGRPLRRALAELVIEGRHLRRKSYMKPLAHGFRREIAQGGSSPRPVPSTRI